MLIGGLGGVAALRSSLDRGAIFTIKDFGATNKRRALIDSAPLQQGGGFLGIEVMKAHELSGP